MRVALGPSIAGNWSWPCIADLVAILHRPREINIYILHTHTGIFTPNDELAEEFMAASEASGEKFWRLPMEESYWEDMKSIIADMLNTGPMQPKGGAITAALFLKQI